MATPQSLGRLHYYSLAMDYAAGNGHLEMQWLSVNRKAGSTTKAMDAAAASDYLDVVKWLHSNRTERCTTRDLDSAAKSGHLEVVSANRSEGLWIVQTS